MRTVNIELGKVVELLSECIILDGAMGTMLQKYGMKIGERPELLNIHSPEIVRRVHEEYVKAGSEILYANTFGANRKKLFGSGYSVEEIISSAVENARVNDSVKVGLSIGPIGEMLEPMGTLSFEEAYEIFAEEVKAAVNSGIDLIAIETMTDLYEVKAAVLAAKEYSDLPIFTTMSFEKDMRTFTGCTVESFATTMNGLGVDAIGINCSLGPVEIFPILERLSQYTELPLIVKANAGMPNFDDTYDMKSAEYFEAVEKISELGVKYIGGCCGTTPEYIEIISTNLKGRTVPRREVKRVSAVCTPTKYLEIDGFTMIGERINPTGKPELREALIKESYDRILSEAIAQEEEGAQVLDVNLGLPNIDEARLMGEVVKEIQSVVSTPLQIDSSTVEVIEAGLRVYNGKPIVNSVNGGRDSLKAVLPLVKKYGAAVIGLTLDENGIPSKAEGRYEIAKRIVEEAESHGIDRRDVFIDCLALTVSHDQSSARESLRAIGMVKELGVKTVLGVSNISFGLPNRDIVNANYLLMALEAGLDLGIINTGSEVVMDALSAYAVLNGTDVNASEFIEKFSIEAVEKTPEPKGDITLEYAVSKGMVGEVVGIVERLLQTVEPMEIIDEQIIPILDRIGDSYDKGEIFLPQLIQSADAAQAGLEIIKSKLRETSADNVSKGKIILATVEGDVHDIGKNLAKLILENYSYKVYDLGRDVKVEKIVDFARDSGIKLVGLSTLMTTTIKNMKETIEELKKLDSEIKIMVGGAVLTEEYASDIGADYYVKDAKANVLVAREVL